MLEAMLTLPNLCQRTLGAPDNEEDYDSCVTRAGERGLQFETGLVMNRVLDSVTLGSQLGQLMKAGLAFN